MSTSDKPVLTEDYAAWLASLKSRIQAAQQRAVLSVNRELALLYWQIGRDIRERQPSSPDVMQWNPGPLPCIVARSNAPGFRCAASGLLLTSCRHDGGMHD